MVRPPFPQRPPGLVGILPALPRHPVPGLRGPIIPPVVRPAGIPSVSPAEKPQTTVYVGKISSTIENDFIISLLQLCGPVKSWKRAQDPTNGVLKGFGFCEFDSAEGVLRAIRLLSKLNVDGQELMLNFNQATREYLERYVEKKRANSKNSQAPGIEGAEIDEEGASSAEKDGPAKSSEKDSKEDDKDMANKDNQDIAKFGLVTEEDREADQEALEKLNGMIEERLQTKPPPPPPPPPPTTMATDGSGTSNSEVPSRSREGDSDVDVIEKDVAEARNDDEMTSESKLPSEHDKPEASSPDRSRRNGRSRDRERDVKQEKERELERYEREREQERVKREKEREYKIREDERRYRVRVKDWEFREREKEHTRKLEREREKEREQERKWEVMDQEHESDDGYSKKRKHKSSGEERKRRQREKEEDLADRLKEKEEIADAKMRAEEEREKQKQEEERVKQTLEEENTLKLLSAPTTTNGSDEAVLSVEAIAENKDKVVDQPSDGDSEHENHTTDRVLQNGSGDEFVLGSVATPDMRQSSNAQTRKLGFGLVGSGKRTAVPSVFHEEEDEDAKKEKKMRPLVPIDYTTEELQAVQNSLSGAPSPNLAAAAEFAKRISSVNSKEERPEAEKDRSKRSHERSLRDRDRNDHETNRARDVSRKETIERDKDQERGLDKTKTPENRKLFDAKQLIDTIPKTKDELFSYEINWAVYDKNDLHERMRPWISKKITEFLGEEETTLVDYIVSTTREHVDASEVLHRLQTILDDEAEMFVLKMWRMLIFEIKKVETGLALRSKG